VISSRQGTLICSYGVGDWLGSNQCLQTSNTRRALASPKIPLWSLNPPNIVREEKPKGLVLVTGTDRTGINNFDCMMYINMAHLKHILTVTKTDWNITNPIRRDPQRRWKTLRAFANASEPLREADLHPLVARARDKTFKLAISPAAGRLVFAAPQVRQLS